MTTTSFKKDSARCSVETNEHVHRQASARILRLDLITCTLKPSRPKRGHVLIPLSGSMAAKASLYLALRDAGITRAQLARRLGLDEKEVRRMLNPRHPTKLPRIEQALAALGRRLVVSLETEAA